MKNRSSLSGVIFILGLKLTTDNCVELPCNLETLKCTHIFDSMLELVSSLVPINAPFILQP